MRKAIALAQQGFPELVRELEIDSHRVLSALEICVLKVFFPKPDDPEIGEHIFVDEISIEGDQIRGVLADSPIYLWNVKEGQTVCFPVTRVTDWFLVGGGVPRGGFTLDLLAAKMDAEERDSIRDKPPFVWYPRFRK